MPGVREVLPIVNEFVDRTPVAFDGQPSGIDPTKLKKAGSTPVDVAMRRGDVLLFNSLLPHVGLPNESNRIRWSIELRFQATGTPTGRVVHPEVVVRSANPANVQRSYTDWSKRWKDALGATRGLSWGETLANISGTVEWRELWEQGRSEEIAARNRIIAAVDAKVGGDSRL